MTAMRSAFTLTEMLVVILVIAALFGLTLPILGKVRAEAATNTTKTLVRSAAAEILRQKGLFITVPPDGNRGERVRRLWDFDGHGFLDGDPALDQRPGGDADPDPGFTDDDRAQARLAGYQGFLKRSGFAASAAQVDARGRLVDAWRQPLRIAFALRQYGPDGFGLWSAGRDGIDNTSDDLLSWSDQP